MTSLNDKDRIDAYTKLADLRMKRWLARRELIWKVTFGFWAFMLAGSVYAKIRPTPEWVIWLATVVLNDYMV